MGFRINQGTKVSKGKTNARQTTKSGGVLLLAYNKSIADELTYKLGKVSDYSNRVTPSLQQQAFLAELRLGSNVILTARAGTGKTSSLMLGLGRHGLNAPAERVSAQTVHSLGFSIWRSMNGGGKGLRVNDKKVGDIINHIADTYPAYRSTIYAAGWSFLRRMVSVLKLNGILSRRCPRMDWGGELNANTLYEVMDSYGLEPKADLSSWQMDGLIEVVDKVLFESWNLDSTEIDFDDMIIAPLSHNGGGIDGTKQFRRYYPKVDCVMVDELQDISRARAELLLPFAHAGAQFIGVGDPMQAIYGFSGAMSGAMEFVRQRTDAKELPLTLSYRCPKNVIREAQKIVPDIEAAGTLEGEVTERKLEDWLKDVDQGTYYPYSTALLCRNNKPLIPIAFQLVNHGIRVCIVGKDIGEEITGYFDRWPEVKNVETLRRKVFDHLTEKARQASMRGREDLYAGWIDRRDTVTEFLKGCEERVRKETGKVCKVADVKHMVGELFVDKMDSCSDVVVLSSVHRAKGREWKNVGIVGRRKFMPSKWALKMGNEETLRQERNLEYVAVTRSMGTLTDLVVEEK